MAFLDIVILEIQKGFVFYHSFCYLSVEKSCVRSNFSFGFAKGIKFLADPEGKTEVTNSNNSTDSLREYVFEKVLFLELLHQSVVFVMSIAAIGHDGAILNVLVIGVVGSSDFEFIVVSEFRRSIDLGEGVLLFFSNDSN